MPKRSHSPWKALPPGLVSHMCAKEWNGVWTLPSNAPFLTCRISRLQVAMVGPSSACWESALATCSHRLGQGKAWMKFARNETYHLCCPQFSTFSCFHVGPASSRPYLPACCSTVSPGRDLSSGQAPWLHFCRVLSSPWKPPKVTGILPAKPISAYFKLFHSQTLFSKKGLGEAQ